MMSLFTASLTCEQAFCVHSPDRAFTSQGRKPAAVDWPLSLITSIQRPAAQVGTGQPDREFRELPVCAPRPLAVD